MLRAAFDSMLLNRTVGMNNIIQNNYNFLYGNKIFITVYTMINYIATNFTKNNIIIVVTVFDVELHANFKVNT